MDLREHRGVRQYSPPKTFPVGYTKVEATSRIAHPTTMFPTTLYYPAKENGANTRPDRGHKPYPAIVFAHGFAFMRPIARILTQVLHTWLCNRTASYGYVVVALESASLNPVEALSTSEKSIVEIIDYLTSQLQSTALNGVADGHAIGVLGHSMGAMAVLGAAAKDKRIKAVVSMAPFYNATVWKVGGRLLPDYVERCRHIKAPTQIVLGNIDFVCRASEAKEYYNALKGTKELLVVSGAFHDLGIMDYPLRTRNLATKYMVNWFDYFLYGHKAAYPHLFGAEAQKDLDAGLLTEFAFEN